MGPRRSRYCIGTKHIYSALCMHEICKKSSKHRIIMDEVCTAGINKYKKSATSMYESGLLVKWSGQNVKASMQNVCKKSAFHQTECEFILANAHFADICTLLKQCARVCPPMMMIVWYVECFTTVTDSETETASLASCQQRSRVLSCKQALVMLNRHVAC